MKTWPSTFAYVVFQSCSHVWLFCGPMDCSPLDSFVHGISQGRILEWVAISCSRGSSWTRDRTWVSCISWTGRWILYPLSHLGSPLLLIVLFCNPLCVCVFICIRKYIVTKLTLKSLYLKIKRQEEIWLADKKENFMYVKKKVWSTMLLITFLNCSFCWLPFSWLTFLHWCLFVFGFVLGGSDL